ncbi:MAG TPA: RICIN domain-containing protein [Nocardioidaceae bacterium]
MSTDLTNQPTYAVTEDASEPAAKPRRRRVTRVLAAATTMALAPAVLLGLAAGPASASTYSATNVYLASDSSASTLFVDVSGASRSWGAQVIQWSLNGGANQKWDIQNLADGNKEFVNANSGQCLTTDGIAGDGVYQFPCVGAKNQEWTTNLVVGNFHNYTIKSASSGLNLDVSGNSSNQGAVIDTWYDNGGGNQHFFGYQG